MYVDPLSMSSALETAMYFDAERFEILRRDFQEAHARIDTGLPCLYAMTQEVRNLHRATEEQSRHIFGFVPTGAYGDEPYATGYWVYAIKRFGSFDYVSECEEFDRLISRAGAMLPNSILGQLPCYSPNVAGRWLAVMWYLSEQPLDTEIDPKTGESSGLLFDGESPFDVSIAAIAKLKLNTDSPQWPVKISAFNDKSVEHHVPLLAQQERRVLWNDLEPLERRIIRILGQMGVTTANEKRGASAIAGDLRIKNDRPLREALSRLRRIGMLNPNGRGYFLLASGVNLFEEGKVITKSPTK